MTPAPPDLLRRILERKREEIAAARQKTPLLKLRAAAPAAPPVRDFIAAITDPARPGRAIIAEVKKASPSKGLLRADFDPVAIARTYAANGARAISVLTDAPFFQGHLDDLRAIRAAVGLPLLRKDFILDPYQIHEARAAGADAVLLIAAALEPDRLAELYAVVHEVGMAALVEVHDEQELTRALALRPRLLGINNRNLGTFQTDLGTTLRLLPACSGLPVVSESGLHRPEDLERLRRAGAAAFLIGEALLAAPDMGAKLRELVGGDGAS